MSEEKAFPISLFLHFHAVRITLLIAPMTSFNYWCIGQDESFAVLSSLDKTVNELKATIIAQDPELQKFSPDRIKLYLANIGDEVDKMHGFKPGTLLQGSYKLSEVFPSAPLENLIHIAIKAEGK